MASSVAAAPMVCPRVALIEFTGIACACAWKHALEHRGLDPVIERGGGAMRAHEVHVSRRGVRFRQRQSHRALEAPTVRLRGRDVGAVAGAGVAAEPAERAAPRVRLAREEHERARLAEEQPAAAAVEGAHLVPRQRAQGVEAAHHEAAEDVVAARDHEVGHVLAQEVGADARARWRPTRRRWRR